MKKLNSENINQFAIDLISMIPDGMDKSEMVLVVNEKYLKHLPEEIDGIKVVDHIDADEETMMAMRESDLIDNENRIHEETI